MFDLSDFAEQRPKNEHSQSFDAHYVQSVKTVRDFVYNMLIDGYAATLAQQVETPEGQLGLKKMTKEKQENIMSNWSALCGERSSANDHQQWLENATLFDCPKPIKEDLDELATIDEKYSQAGHLILNNDWTVEMFPEHRQSYGGVIYWLLTQATLQASWSRGTYNTVRRLELRALAYIQYDAFCTSAVMNNIKREGEAVEEERKQDENKYKQKDGLAEFHHKRWQKVALQIQEWALNDKFGASPMDFQTFYDKTVTQIREYNDAHPRSKIKPKDRDGLKRILTDYLGLNPKEKTPNPKKIKTTY